MEERAQNPGPIREQDEEHGPAETVIACDTRQRSQNLVADQRRLLLRKLADGFLDFLGHHRTNEPFRNRLRD